MENGKDGYRGEIGVPGENGRLGISLLYWIPKASSEPPIYFVLIRCTCPKTWLAQHIPCWRHCQVLVAGTWGSCPRPTNPSATGGIPSIGALNSNMPGLPRDWCGRGSSGEMVVGRVCQAEL